MRLINLNHLLLHRRLARDHLLESPEVVDLALEPLVAQHVGHVLEDRVLGAQAARDEGEDLLRNGGV